MILYNLFFLLSHRFMLKTCPRTRIKNFFLIRILHAKRVVYCPFLLIVPVRPVNSHRNNNWDAHKKGDCAGHVQQKNPVETNFLDSFGGDLDLDFSIGQVRNDPFGGYEALPFPSPQG